MKGSVYKRCRKCGGNVAGRSCAKCRTNKFKWAFRVFTGRDADGNWIEERQGGFDTKSAAEQALTSVLASVKDGTFVQRSTITVAEYLRDQWLAATEPPQVKYETWQDRNRNLRHHVIPRIGQVRLQELSATHLNRLYRELLDGGRVDAGEGGLSPTSVHRIHSMLRKALNDAVRWGLVVRNVVPEADPPPARTVQAARRRSMRTWTEDDLHRFLDATVAHPLHRMWRLAAFTGMRRSEFIGLRWDDLDLEARMLTVRSTVLPVGDKTYELVVDQKTTGSARTIHLDAGTVATLRQQHADVAAMRRLAGERWKDHGLVFPQEDGSWWNPPAVSLAFRRARDRAGMPKIRLHDLRHTHATLLLKAGVNPKVVSERLGHSSVAFTLDTYAHVMPGMQPEAVELFSRLVLGPGEVGEDPDGGGADTASEDGKEYAL